MEVRLGGGAPPGVGATGKSSNQASLKEIDTGPTMTSRGYDFITLIGRLNDRDHFPDE